MSSTIRPEAAVLRTTNKRPFWLKLFCILLWLYELYAIPFFLFAILLSNSFHDDAGVAFYLIAMAYLVIIAASSIGLWRMKKWGGLLYAVFVVFDCIPTVLASGQLTPLKMLPVSILLMFSLRDALSYESYILVHNIIYYIPIILAGIGILMLWRSGKLT